MMNNNPMMNQMDQNPILQMIQKNNEQIIQMIQQIFQVQMLNNLLLNQILNNNLKTNNNINNNMLNNTISQMNNIVNNMKMINNQNMQNMMSDSHNNSNDINLWVGNTAPKINILFERINEKGYQNNSFLLAPNNISIKELIEAYFKKLCIADLNKQRDFIFIFNGKALNKTDCSTLKENGFDNFSLVVIKISESGLRGG